MKLTWKRVHQIFIGLIVFQFIFIEADEGSSFLGLLLGRGLDFVSMRYFDSYYGIAPYLWFLWVIAIIANVATNQRNNNNEKKTNY